MIDLPRPAVAAVTTVIVAVVIGWAMSALAATNLQSSRAVTLDTTTSAAPQPKDSPLFLSIDFPPSSRPGTTIRFSVTCSKPIVDGYSPAIDASTAGGIFGFEALSGDVVLTPTGFIYDWAIPANQQVGQYGVTAFCDSITDVLEPVTLPVGVGGGPFILMIVDEEPSSSHPIPSAL